MLAGMDGKDEPAAADPAPAAVAAEEVETEAAAAIEDGAAEEVAAVDEPDETADPADKDEIAEIELDSPDSLGPKDLAEKLDASPEIKALLDQNPELRDQMFANARLADQAKEYREIFGSPAEAKIVAEGHQTYTGLRDLIGSVKERDPQSTQAVISAMLAQATLRDANGEILKDAAGNPITDGTIGRFLTNTFQMRLGLIEAQAKQRGDDETLAALDTIMERSGLRAPSSASEDEMSEELKTQKAQIEKERKELDDRKASDSQQSQKAHDERVFGRIDSVLDRQIASILDRSTGLTPFTRKSTEESIRKGLNAALRKNSAFQSELELVERIPVGKERAQRHVALATRYIQDHLFTVARPVLTEAGATVQKTAQAKAKVQAARAEAAQSEVRGSQPAPKAQPTDSAGLIKQITEELTTKLGYKPSFEQVLAEKMTRGLAAAGAR